MKKRVIITILFLSALTLSGCGQQSSPQDNGEEQTPDQNVAPENTTEKEDTGSEGTSTPGEIEGEDISGGNATTSITDWRTYSKELKSVKIQYPENWYHRRSLSQELDNDYYLYVEFAPTSKVLRGEATSSVELIGADQEKEVAEKEYFVTVKETGNKKFILRTNNREKFQDIMKKMATTFQQLK